MNDDTSTIYYTEYVDFRGRKGKGHIHFGGTASGVDPETAARVIEELNLFPGFKEVSIHPSRAKTPGDLAAMVKMVPKEPRSSQVLVPDFSKSPKPEVGSRFETLIGLEKEDEGEETDDSRFEEGSDQKKVEDAVKADSQKVQA
jgi:hypothetical protein